MTAAEFKKKWSRYQGKESSAYQEHFADLCRLLGQPTPVEADPSGTELFCFQKRVVQEAELLDLHGTPDAGDPRRPGFADVWKKGCFGWEYKGKHKNLDEAYRQLQRYRESLLNKNARQTNAEWWQYERPRVDMRKAMTGLNRFITTPGVSKHRIYVWRTPETLCNQGTLVFAREDDYFFGVVQSRMHEVWALAQGTQLREKESGFRYTPTTCFETFPFPFPDDLHPPAAPPVKPSSKPRQPEPDRTYAENLAAKNYFMGKEEPSPYGGSRKTPDEYRADIAAAAERLNVLREHWLNPPEWTIETILKFPGSINGPWARYVAQADENGVGTVRYPRLEPRDSYCAAKLKERTLTKLYNERPDWLDLAHKKLDAAVAAAYGWPNDLSDEQILERLLALNLERSAEEAKAAKVKKPKTSREKRSDEML